jgi:hypothetical protein
MRDLSVVVENLRLVQRARRRFMELWAVEQECIIPMLDRMAEDLQRAGAAATATNAGNVAVGDATGSADGPAAGLNPPAGADEES